MATKVFVTGITGKSGDAMLSEIISKGQGDYEYTFLVRDAAKAEILRKRCPEANVVLGSLTESEMIRSALIGGGIKSLFI